MYQLVTLIRLIYLLKHNCHNLVSKISFFADHEFLGSSYEMSLKHYDSIIERMIGLNIQFDLLQVQDDAVKKLQQIPLQYKDNAECFFAILGVNKAILQLIEGLAKAQGISQGTIQLIGTIADEIEVENYKLQQRLKGREK